MAESPVSGTSMTLASDATESDHVRTDAMTVRSFHAGLELGGRYRLVAPLGKGGMGEVWEAEHTMLGRTVAIKLVLADAKDAELAVRLQREAELVARLEHPNIVAVTDFGLVTPHQPFVVMERLTGRTLSELLQQGGPLSWTQARDIAVQIAEGLACAHAAGIVHRDLKPSNVFVLADPHGRLRIKIIDFGLAKATVLGPGDRALTKSGAVFGTPAYMAPEQVRGEAVDGRVDTYALGAIVYEMIVGERLWKRGSMAALLYCHLFEPAPTIRARVPEAPVDLDVLVARCLCKDRAMRPFDMDALRLELVGVGSGKGSTIVPQDVIPVPAAGVRARYATVVPVDGAMPLPAASVPVASPQRWVVPTVIGVLVAIAASLVMLLPRVGLFAPTEAPESSPAIDVAPVIEAAPVVEAVPADAPPVVDTRTPAVEASPIAVGDPGPANAGGDAAKEEPPISASSKSTPRPRPRPRVPATTPTSKPTEPAPDPVAPEPITPPVPVRKGDRWDWPKAPGDDKN